METNQPPFEKKVLHAGSALQHYVTPGWLLNTENDMLDNQMYMCFLNA